eukprot:CAMPEP_0177258730 /NCGR_PEP_ID=MMETSP0367-20130122/58262_1 /TAXON_ID=447022 ORGANISM="Scrippsiella hangoei-like, Strain SHHI-4" /NCGR_SAMPLE_ID=MMETSP0367 /ASSEMBLY_ACC=CAM_ASM_000362 /LENGTH=200 /DNA_ID=CAMNT_0018712963 /DNA_START=18 /DNA_END=618 /DNA_ORIENTATION=-
MTPEEGERPDLDRDAIIKEAEKHGMEPAKGSGGKVRICGQDEGGDEKCAPLAGGAPGGMWHRVTSFFASQPASLQDTAGRAQQVIVFDWDDTLMCTSFLMDLKQQVSARSRFADQLPGSPGEWKLHAFLELERVFDAEATPNLISIGDAVHEITAAKVLGRKLASAMVKTVRLRDVPKPRLLLQEVRFLTRQLKGFVDLS